MDWRIIITIALAIIGLIVVGIVLSFFSVWLRAWLAGAYVGIVNLVAMRLRQVPYGLMVDARITAKKAGIEISIDDIEAHYLAGGNVVPTVQALIAAQKAGITLDWQRACAIDLATKGSGKSVVEAVRTSVDPKVIDCPNPEAGRTTIDGVAKDGIQVKVKARVTVRTNLDRFVGGAKEETIIARVGEGIVTTIGSAESYKVVLESPDSDLQGRAEARPRCWHGVSRFSPSTSPTWTWARTWARSCRRPRPRRTRTWRRRRRKSAARRPWPSSRK
jgi:uncharacterized protein YqfA (UPF0365 family)